MVNTKNIFREVRKRDGRIVSFEQNRITNAISHAMHASGEGDPTKDAERVSDQVVNTLLFKFKPTHIPSIEEIQDIVETQLMAMGFSQTAKAYILYRNERARVREEKREVPEHVRALARESKQYFRDALGEFVYYRTYSRWIDGESRRETWIETVDRYVSFMKENLGEKLSSEEYAEVRTSILKQEVMPSMRLLQFAGEAARSTNVCAYNCSFIAPSAIQDFGEIMYISMCGTGVGFSVESQNIQSLPQIKPQTGKMLPTYVIDDSKEGWADALVYGMQTWYDGADVEFDFSQLRPAGARLKTMGGKSSGPDPLREVLVFARRKILRRQGKRLTNIDAHDVICKIGEIVVAGGVRRSALISLSDLDDHEMRGAKTGQFYLTEPQRSLANNSAVYTERPSNTEFMEEWLALMRSGTGERGIFNRGSLAKTLPKRRIEALGGYIGDLGTNPCGEIILQSKQFCVKGDTFLVTRDGIARIQDAVGKEIEVWNGKMWSRVVPRKTGVNQKMVRIRLNDGSYLDCTPDHRFSVKHRFQGGWREVQAKDLQHFSRYAVQVEPSKIVYTEGIEYPEAYDLGVVVGDGHVYGGRVYVDLYGEKDFALPVHGTRHKEYLPSGYAVSKVRVRTNLNALLVSGLRRNADALHALFTWDRPSILNFVAGLIDADGSETVTGGVRLYISDFERARMVQLLLTKCGIPSSVNLMQKKGARTNLGERKRDIYYLQITDCSDIPCKRVDTSRGHAARFKGKYQTIRSAAELPGLHDSFCFEELGEHKAVFNNVLTHQCNLSEVIARPKDTEESLLRKIRIATILGTYQATLTSFTYLSKEWREHCESERLLGVSLTGQWDSPAVRNPNVLAALKAHAIEINEKYAARFGIRTSACITCTKPSGNLSQTVGCASGLHPRHARYYIRRVRIAHTDSLFKMLKEQSIPYHPEVGQAEDTATTYVVDFPVKSPEGSVLRDDLSALELLEHWKVVKEKFTEHNPSVTISIGDDEWIEVANWLYKNWDIIGGLSFLPRSNHVYKLAPYEEISEETYLDLSDRYKGLDFSRIMAYEKKDETEIRKELACAGGVCEIEEIPTVVSATASV